jgi:5-formyltetrahydrofolate cyclo-ligase
MRTRRNELSAQEALSAGTKILARVLASETFRTAPMSGGFLALYVSAQNEPDFSDIIPELIRCGIRVCFPGVRDGNIRYYAADSTESFVMSQWGILEPPERSIEISSDQITTMLVPGLAFDLHGGRVGRGGGFYDALLSGIPQKDLPVLIGTCHDFQIVQRVPCEKTDFPMHYVVTPERWIEPVDGIYRENGEFV